MYHRLALATICALVLLILMGAVVRVTGSGLGCPDWPTCWGCLVPPTDVDQIDVEKLDLEKFKKHAERKGLDPNSITRDTVLASFDPVRTWIEFLNRLTSLPLGFLSLALALLSFRANRHRGWVMLLAWLALLNVLANAVMGAIVVRSGLQPNIITFHMALAFLLITNLVTIFWLTRPVKVEAGSQTREVPSREASAFSPGTQAKSGRLKLASILFLVCLIGEGLLGSQVREQTDELSRMAGEVDSVGSAGKLIGDPPSSATKGASIPQPIPDPVVERENTGSTKYSRRAWIEKLETTLVYKIHRSFSWALLVISILIFAWSGRQRQAGVTSPHWILAIVVCMMIMGVVMAHIAVYPVVQVTHVVGTAILLAIAWHWFLQLMSPPSLRSSPPTSTSTA